jgi:dolichol-phosphate mannosyltransferase
MPTLSIVVPVFNEQGLIKELINQLKLNLNGLTEDYEIVIIDDGSKDDTWEKIKVEASQDKRVKGLKLSRNFGHHYAITAGLHNAKGKWVVVMDGDLQDRPEVIPHLFKKANEGNDVVFVNRKNRTESYSYILLQRIYYKMLNYLSGVKFNPEQANFSIINRKVVEAFIEFPENARFYASTIKWLGFKTASIDAEHGKRFIGKPSYTFKKRIKLATDVIIAFSDRPLKVAINLGIFISLISFLFLLWFVLKWFFVGVTVNGWFSLIFFTLFLGGIILIVLGIIGVYIGRIYTEVKKRPLYVIDESTTNLF